MSTLQNRSESAWKLTSGEHTEQSVLFSDTRIVEIDGLRGVAVLLVLIWHFIGAVISPKLGAYAGLVGSILIFGRTGVDLFFVLSGFLIVGILVDHRDAGNYFRVFFARRALRILPPYLLLLMVFWLICAVAPENYYFGWQIPWWSYLTFTQNWFIIKLNSWGPGGASVTWSVAIEEQFYLFFPFIILLIRRNHLMSVLLSLGALSAAARAVHFAAYPHNLFAPYVATVFRLDGLCAGGVIALLFRNSELRRQIELFRPLVARAQFACFSVIPVFLICLHSDPARTMYYWGHTYLTLLYSLVLVTVLLRHNTSISRLLSTACLRQLGTISYSVYLFHPLIIGLVFLSLRKKEELASITDAALLLAALVLTLGICSQLYGLIERKCVALGHRLRYSNPALEKVKLQVTR